MYVFTIEILIRMKFHIPEPCHEKWDEMTPTEKGAFCQKCALEVTDFTKKSPYEIRDILTQKFQKKERSCGHITQRQLNDVNDIGFYWKNEQHRFQSVWMVSLLAVFGLTLFSCQNTFTKELVSEMEEKGQVLLEEEEESSKEPATNEPDKATNDSLSNENVLKLPNIDVPFDGLVALKPSKELTITCQPILMGNMSIVLGAVGYPEEPKNPTWEDLTAQFGPRDSKLPEGVEQVAPQPRNNIGARTDMVYDTETDDFIAYISPAPVQVESQLIVESFDDIELHVVLENTESQQQHTNKPFQINEGVHSFELNLDKLPKGFYRIALQTWKTRQSLEFLWQGFEKESV